MLVGTRPVKAYLTMSLGLGVCTVLAMIAKENGILLPLLVGVLEFTLLGRQNPRVAALDKRWATLFLLVPGLIILAYLALHTFRSNFFTPNPPRDFSTYERLLTEFRILFDYLRHWFLPVSSTPGVFQDHFIFSVGFLAPLTTLLSAVFHAVLVWFCIVKRYKWPLLSFAVLFFYASHLLESTVLNLELYFEHRNYLASAFLFLPLLVLLEKKLSRSLFSGVVVTMLAVLGGLTYVTTNVWASYPTIVESAARKVPNSARAQQQFSLLLYNAQRYQESLQVVNEAIARIPGDEQLLIWRATIRCNLGMLTSANFQTMKAAVAPREYDLRALDLYEALVNSVVNGNCAAVSADELSGLFTEMLQVPGNGDPRSAGFSQIRYLMGVVDIHRREVESAMKNFEQSLQSRPGASRAMLMASLMASKEFYDEALELSAGALVTLEGAEDGLLRSAQVSEQDILEFRQKVREESAKMNKGQAQPNESGE
jgi:tetratricopeptide (TPR) repeat protein